MAEFKPTELFGGAIVADLPTAYIDASDLRQVPDHQEVYLDRDGFTSIVVEILQRVEAPNDEDSMKEHLQDLTGDDASNVVISPSGVSPWPSSSPLKLPPGTPVYTLDAVAPPGKNEQNRIATLSQQGGVADDGHVSIHLGLIRLAAQTTDILVTVNVPSAQKVVPAEEIRARLLATFEVKDMGLFA